MKTVTLKLKGYQIEGVADITLWGGDNACIEMRPFEVTRLKEIRTGLNDSGFGVESINGAICEVARLYENGYKVYTRTLFINKISENTLDYYFNS